MKKNRNHLSRISRFLLFSALSAFSAVNLSAAKPQLDGTSNASPARTFPNILFIAVDDLRTELGCYGVDAIHSPNIDALAASGIQFNRAYCQLAVCNPSRVSVLTGLRPDSSKVWTLDVRFRDTVPDVVTLPAHFKANGYTTVSFGKIFHNPWPDNRSWSEPHAWPEKSKLWSENGKKRLAEYREKMRADGKSERAIQRMRAPATEIVDIPDHEHIDGAIAQQAITALRRLATRSTSSGQKKPFFLAAGFVRPHLPFVVPRKYWDLYEREAIPLAANTAFPKNYPGNVPAMNTMYELRDYMDYAETPAAGEGLLTIAQQRELKHGYYASVSLIDAQVGLVLGELDTLGLADNTVVVFWSDHGWKLGEHGSWCKQTNYETDTRVPLIIRSPAHEKNRREAASSASPAPDSNVTLALVELLDLYPTLCDLAGLPLPDHVEGASLVPLLKNPNAAVKDAAFSQFYRRLDGNHYMGYAMRTDRYRYVDWIDRRTKKTVATELYDHKSDPGENSNLAANSKNKDLVAQLKRQLWKTLPPPPDFVAAAPAPKQERPALHLVNKVDDPLTVTWLKPDGGRRESGTIQPGDTHRINTTLGHRFLVENPVTGFVQTLTVTKQNQTITFSRRAKKAAKPQLDGTSRSPNILFIMGDDWSWPHASALGDPVVKTPAFDRIAREGVLFENAFVSAPSCTPSRFAVATGQVHWRLGEGKNLGGSLAADVPVYPDLLAEAGYRTGFCRKGASPSKHSYRKNDPFGPSFESFEDFFTEHQKGEPFCFWHGAGEPHRPYNWQESIEYGIDLDAIAVPACLPDNKTVRTDLGDYYVKVQRLDSDAAKMLALLEKSGELKNTIVIMTGDNGMPFPRCKATLYDTGTRVPLVIRWGAKAAGGRRVSDFVSLTDLAPTFLEAAGLAVPDAMTGRSLLGHLTSGNSGRIDPARDHVLTGMERHVYPNPSRAIRNADFLYIRNFSPETWPTGVVGSELPSVDFEKDPWPSTVPGAFAFNVDPSPTKQWMLEHDEKPDDLRLYQLAFSSRPGEELYDLAKDPAQLHNVAANPAFAKTRNALRARLQRELRATEDPRAAPRKKRTASVGVDLRPQFEARGLEVRHQGERGSCQVFALAGALEYELSKPGHPVDLSEQFLMWAANDASSLDNPTGYRPDTLIKGLRDHGICDETLMPYVPANEPVASPSSAAREAAAIRRQVRVEHVKHWYNQFGLTDAHLQGIRDWLDDGKPVTATFSWAFGTPFNETLDEQGFVLDLGSDKMKHNGHGVILVGYRNDPAIHGGGYFILRNSWGPDYGDDGYAKVSYAFAKRFGIDAYRVSLIADNANAATAPLKSHRTHRIKGWTLHINESLWREEPAVIDRATEILNLQLERVIKAVPEKALARLRTVPLWVNPPYPDARPTAEYHPEAGWLREHGRDPAMAKAMEFTNARILPFENRRMPYVVLHELAHAYHDQVLGFDHPEIIEAYKAAKASGSYAKVKRPGHEDQEAYAMTNGKEYFAETTEAYFGKNDFYPLTRDDLKKHDPKMFKILKKLWASPPKPE